MNTCKGCRIIRACSLLKIEEQNPRIKYNIFCPCKECILKMMCTEQCKDYIKLVRQAALECMNVVKPRTTRIKKKR